MPGELKDFIRVPLEQVTKPRHGFLQCYLDYWWAVTDKDEVLFYRHKYHSPQCNSNEAIVERIAPDGTTPRLVPAVFLPHDCNDYR